MGLENNTAQRISKEVLQDITDLNKAFQYSKEQIDIIRQALTHPRATICEAMDGMKGLDRDLRKGGYDDLADSMKRQWGKINSMVKSIA